MVQRCPIEFKPPMSHHSVVEDEMLLPGVPIYLGDIWPHVGVHSSSQPLFDAWIFPPLPRRGYESTSIGHTCFSRIQLTAQVWTLYAQDSRSLLSAGTP
nr:homeobox protein Hox-C4 isoform X6 [Pelodiscus sinensis]|eukprot:XP_014432372.1 homeobox protein Hox-C4 isoform X6 [Pelodiscus sinensis]